MSFAAPGGATRVLLVDDDRSLLRMASLSLGLDGFDVMTASNGVEALELAAEHAFEAIVLDLQMPVMDGRSFYRELRARGDETPVLVLSAYTAEKARQELGAEAAISKPFELDVLESTLRGLVGSRGADDGRGSRETLNPRVR